MGPKRARPHVSGNRPCGLGAPIALFERSALSSRNRRTPIPSRRYAAGFWLIFVLFACRVVAQPLALVVHSALLAPFESWHSAALPYGVLLASQVIILGALGWTAWRFTKGDIAPRRIKGAIVLALGAVYFVTMVARLMLGLTVFHDVRWFASPIPTLFHLVLASSLLLYGRFHYSGGEPVRPGR